MIEEERSKKERRRDVRTQFGIAIRTEVDGSLFECALLQYHFRNNSGVIRWNSALVDCCSEFEGSHSRG